MKKLSDFKNEIYKCSKCGLCQGVCPLYKNTLKESSVSRGKFIMLNGVIKGDLELNNNIKKHIDMCLNCNACKRFCPSDIDACQIFATAKYEIEKLNPQNHIIKYLKSSIFMEHSLKLAGIFLNLYRFFKINFFIDKFFFLLAKCGEPGKKILLFNSFAKINIKHKTNKNQAKKSLTVIYFEGCVNKYLNPSTKNAVLNILEEYGINVIKPDFSCCGISDYSNGFFDIVEKKTKNFLKKLPQNFDYILTDCASCNFMLKKYGEFSESVKNLSNKIISFTELLDKINYNHTFAKQISVTYHKPCHSEFNIENFVNKLNNIEYKKSEKFDECCGFSGKFALMHPHLSEKISKVKAENLSNTDSDYIITECPACVLGITQGLIEIKNNKKVLNIAEFINLE